MDKLPNYANRKFLLVDDEFFMLGLIERVLRDCKAGLVLRAPNGAAAIDLINSDKTHVDCVIADLNMTPVNGLQLLKTVRTGAHAKIPRDQRFVMLTGHGDSDAVHAAIALDVDGYILKPISVEKLTTTIDRVFSRTPALKSVAHYEDTILPAPAT
jgi:YesN/AraC family two-component response regulator